MKKKIFSILLLFAMVVTMMPAMAFAANNESAPEMPVVIAKAIPSGTQAVKISWPKTAGAIKYVVYGNQSGKTSKILKTLGETKTSLIVKKISGKKLKKNKVYKFYVSAYSEESKRISQSKICKVIVGKTKGKNKKYSNATSISIKNKLIKLEAGDTGLATNLAGISSKMYKNKKHLSSKYGSKYRYTVLDKNRIKVDNTVVTIGKTGKLQINKDAKVGDTANVYVQELNGVYNSFKIVVVTADELLENKIAAMIAFSDEADGIKKFSDDNLSGDARASVNAAVDEIKESAIVAILTEDNKDAFDETRKFAINKLSAIKTILEELVKTASKGDIIKFVEVSGDGFRIIKKDGTNAEILAMNGEKKVFFTDSSTDTVTFNAESKTIQKYAGSNLDNYLNGTNTGDYFASLPYRIKDAIVPQDIYQYAYTWEECEPEGGITCWTAQWGYGESIGAYFIPYDSNAKLYVGKRNVYALDIKDVIEYIGEGNITAANINLMLFNQDTSNSHTCWLRSADIFEPDFVMYIEGGGGSITDTYYDSVEARAAFTIDLSKVTYNMKQTSDAKQGIIIETVADIANANNETTINEAINSCKQDLAGIANAD